LRISCLPADQLELELTESALMEDPELAAGMLRGLRVLGLHFSVDDFGTGYSSLSYLCRFPLDTLKLDRSFLAQHDSHDIGPRSLAKAIINMAHTLNLSVVAEGVETEEHLGFLEKTLCDGVQGFLFSEPLIAKDFERLLQSPDWPGATKKLEAAGNAPGCAY
jgi:EAL domain-containing protein (putative c-di-GMP-specific phosphodiesterase class I)